MRASPFLTSPMSLAGLAIGLALSACGPRDEPPPAAPPLVQSRAPERPLAPLPQPLPQSPPAEIARPVAQDRPQRPTPSPPPPPASSDRRLPLARILSIARARVPGEVIEVGLDEDDDDDDPPVYMLKILTPEGRAIEMELDARTGAVIEIEED